MSAYVCDRCEELKDDDYCPLHLVIVDGAEQQACETCTDALRDQADDKVIALVLDGRPYVPGSGM